MSDGVLIPRTVFVGDTAEFLYPISKLKNYDLNKLKSGEFSIKEIVQNESMIITGFEIKQKSNELFISIQFTPWDVGEIEFPSFKAFGVFEQLPKIKIASILEETNTETIQPMRPPLLIPGTTFLILSITFIILFSVLAIFIIGLKIRKNFSKKPLSLLKKRRIRKFNSTLSKLNKCSGRLKDNDVWLKEYELNLRSYIEAAVTHITPKKNNNHFNAMTYTEITNKLNTFFSTNNEPVIIANKILQSLQLSRYARNKTIKNNSFDKTQKELIFLAKKFINQSENECKKLENSNTNDETKIAVNNIEAKK